MKRAVHWRHDGVETEAGSSELMKANFPKGKYVLGVERFSILPNT